MGRYLKNTQLDGGAYAVQLPMGTSSIGPDSPVNGLIRFNQTTNKIEFYYNSQWNQVAKIGTVQLVVDNFTGDNVAQTFVMSQAESDPNSIAVFVGGVYQQPNVNYTVNGSLVITFTSPPPAPGINPNQVIVIHNLNSTNAA
jgi:hypothetical protein